MLRRRRRRRRRRADEGDRQTERGRRERSRKARQAGGNAFDLLPRPLAARRRGLLLFRADAPRSLRASSQRAAMLCLMNTHSSWTPRWPAPISPPLVFVSTATSARARAATLSPDQANYLLNVLRLGPGRARADLQRPRRRIRRLDRRRRAAKPRRLRSASARGRRNFRPTSTISSPRSSTRGSTMSRRRRSRWARAGSSPVVTRRTQAARVNLERLRANAREAAEQCGVIWLPEIEAPERLDTVLADWPAERLLVFCDEDAPQANPVAALAERAPTSRRHAADRSRGRVRRGGARGDRPPAARPAFQPRPAHPARRHRRGRRAGAHPKPIRRLALIRRGRRRAAASPGARSDAACAERNALRLDRRDRRGEDGEIGSKLAPIRRGHSARRASGALDRRDSRSCVARGWPSPPRSLAADARDGRVDRRSERAAACPRSRSWRRRPRRRSVRRFRRA